MLITAQYLQVNKFHNLQKIVLLLFLIKKIQRYKDLKKIKINEEIAEFNVGHRIK